MRTISLVSVLIAAQLAAAQSVVARQAGGTKYEISGTMPGARAVSLSGSATGVVLCDSAGRFSGFFDVATPGPALVSPYGSGGGTTVMLGNSAPGIVFAATVVQPGRVRFAGVVNDEAPLGLTVTLAGPPGVNGNTATVGMGGAWALELNHAGPVSGITATVTDWFGLRASRTLP